MTPTKHRALIALADATDRPFLSAAPLMAIVEAVAVLDEAGLLALPPEEVERRLLAVLDPPRIGSKRSLMSAVLALPWVSTVNYRVEPGAPAMIIETGDAMGLDDTRSAELRAALDTQRAAGTLVWVEIDGRPFVHPDGRPDTTVAACSSCGAIDGDSHLSGCDRDDPAAPPMQARLIEPLATVPCPKCGEPLNGGQTCLNFPACPNSEMPF